MERSSFLPHAIWKYNYLYQVQHRFVNQHKKCLFLFYIENQSACQPCNVHVSGSTGNGYPYCHGMGCKRNQQCPYVSKVYTEHTRNKIRPLKYVSATEMILYLVRLLLKGYCHFKFLVTIFGWASLLFTFKKVSYLVFS